METSYEKSIIKLAKNSFRIDGKMGYFNRAPEVLFQKSIDIGITDLLFEVKFTSSVSIFQMILSNLPEQCPRAL